MVTQTTNPRVSFTTNYNMLEGTEQNGHNNAVSNQYNYTNNGYVNFELVKSVIYTETFEEIF